MRDAGCFNPSRSDGHGQRGTAVKFPVPAAGKQLLSAPMSAMRQLRIMLTPEEYLERDWLALRLVPEMIASGALADAKTILGLLLARAALP